MKKLFSIILLLLAASNLSGQTLHSLYFLEGNDQRDELNPAFAPDHNFVAIPIIGNININANSNLGLKAIMQPCGNDMVTFLSPKISTEDAMKNFKKNNTIETDLDINIFKMGFHKWKGMNTIGLSVRSQSGVYLPKEVFQFLKEGQQDAPTTEYNMSDIDAVTQNYVQLALGHSHAIGQKFTIGGKVKFLFGGAYSKAHVENMNISMSGNEWIINQNSSLITSKGLNMTTDNDGKIDNFKFENWGLAGFGLGLDLGAAYKITNSLNVSLAVTDLGFINWKECQSASNKNKSFRFNGFDNIASENSDDFNDAADEVWDNLKGLVEYHKDNELKSDNRLLYTTIRGAVEYGVLRNKISFGLLSSTRIGAPEIWTEAMLSANFRPSSWFSATVNGSYSNVRNSLGAAINFHPKAINFFVGMDYFLNHYGKQFVPVDAAKVNLGMGLSINY